MNDQGESILVRPPTEALGREITALLRSEIERCHDVAFAHLVEVEVPVGQTGGSLALFVWLLPRAMGSLRASVNLLSEVVARVLPEDRYLDVLILNSAPELLDRVEAAGCLLVECDPEERRRALEAAAVRGGDGQPAAGPRRPWWPF